MDIDENPSNPLPISVLWKYKQNNKYYPLESLEKYQIKEKDLGGYKYKPNRENKFPITYLPPTSIDINDKSFNFSKKDRALIRRYQLNGLPKVNKDVTTNPLGNHIYNMGFSFDSDYKLKPLITFQIPSADYNRAGDYNKLAYINLIQNDNIPQNGVYADIIFKSDDPECVSVGLLNASTKDMDRRISEAWHVIKNIPAFSLINNPHITLRPEQEIELGKLVQ